MKYRIISGSIATTQPAILSGQFCVYTSAKYANAICNVYMLASCK